MSNLSQRCEKRHDIGLDAGRYVERPRLSRCGEQCARDVVNMDVVASWLPEAEYLRRLSAPEEVGEDRDDAGLTVRTLPRAVHIAEAAHRVLQPARFAPRMM
jgi:hypothetical protein